MKFADLTFEPHPLGYPGHEIARHDFPNGYGISVLAGERFYTDLGHPYEVGVWKDGHLSYKTPITDDVLGHQTQADVQRLLDAIEALPSAREEVA